MMVSNTAAAAVESKRPASEALDLIPLAIMRHTDVGLTCMVQAKRRRRTR